LHYFAYGSNMNWQQMQHRCPSSRFVSIGRLMDYQFGITRHSRLRDCGTANVYPAPGQEVWGVIYDVCVEDLAILDGFEDGYRREMLAICPPDAGQQPIAAVVYIAAVEENVPRPNAEYRRLIVEGAKHWQLPPSYLVLLEAIRAGAGA
jgi:gamma-glutamylcyclotransferase